MFSDCKKWLFGVLSVALVVLGSAVPAKAAVTDMFTSAAVQTALEGWTADVGGVLATAVGVAFALLAVYSAIGLIRRIATRGTR